MSFFKGLTDAFNRLQELADVEDSAVDAILSNPEYVNDYSDFTMDEN